MSVAEREGLDFMVEVPKAVTKLAAGVSDWWPRTNLEGVEGVQSEPKPPKVADPKHRWIWIGRFWQYTSCLRGFRGHQEPATGVYTRELRVDPVKFSSSQHRCLIIDFSDCSFAPVCQL